MKMRKKYCQRQNVIVITKKHCKTYFRCFDKHEKSQELFEMLLYLYSFRLRTVKNANGRHNDY
jgi:uncharacterized CHY-type Zn-finger protein